MYIVAVLNQHSAVIHQMIENVWADIDNKIQGYFAANNDDYVKVS